MSFFVDPLGERWHVCVCKVLHAGKKTTVYLHAETRDFLWDDKTMAAWVAFADPSSRFPAIRSTPSAGLGRSGMGGSAPSSTDTSSAARRSGT